ncbi:MAG TPA: hypothetical protein VGD45_14120 [Steroidobacter sp.]|uniref:hypothetical protein n=1 Tax=Steroidobacter sp. TaxID=1978227 RepID=UPI002ED7C9DA
MNLLILVALASGSAFVLQAWRGSWWLSVCAPVVGFVLWILFDSYVLPYRGGGASMWPLAILFGTPVAFLGAIFGVMLARSIAKDDQE